MNSLKDEAHAMIDIMFADTSTPTEKEMAKSTSEASNERQRTTLLEIVAPELLPGSFDMTEEFFNGETK